MSASFRTLERAADRSERLFTILGAFRGSHDVSQADFLMAMTNDSKVRKAVTQPA